MEHRIFELIRDQLVQLNRELRYDYLEEISPSTPIYGTESSIDSLSLVSLIVGLEQDIARQFGRPVLLATDRAFSARRSPFREVGSLVEFIAEQLKESNDARHDDHRYQ